MPRYEYKVVPSPRKGEKARDAKTTPDRFALALTSLMNKLGARNRVEIAMWAYETKRIKA